MTIQQLVFDLYALQNPAHTSILQRFFKTGKGEYGEGDQFLGIKVPQIRKLLPHYQHLKVSEITQLITSPYHEIRLTALLLLVKKSQKSKDPHEQAEIAERYLAHTASINSRDLVDLSAPQILGAHYANHNRSILYQLAQSSLLRERRIAIVSTHYFIKQGKYQDTLAIAKLLLNDPHDLIHKATGRMLREVHKRGGEQEIYDFLDQYSTQMPRTMLRYSIERFPEPRRHFYLQQKPKPFS